MAAASIGVTYLAGWLLGRWLKIDPQTSWLIASGTAICGGSAIAAVATVLDAGESQMTVSMGTVFFTQCGGIVFICTHWPCAGSHAISVWRVGGHINT